MSLFAKMKEAKENAGGLYLQPGNYLVEVSDIKQQASSVGHQVFYIVEMKILESDNDELRPGMEPAWLVDLTMKYENLALGNVKAFLRAAYGTLAIAEGEEVPDQEDIGMDEAEASCTGILNGTKVYAKAFNITTKSGNPFTKVSWAPYAEDE